MSEKGSNTTRVGPDALDRLHDRVADFVELDVGGREERVLLVGSTACALSERRVADLDAVERPAVRLGGLCELALGLRQRDPERPLAACAPVEQELQAERRLAGPRLALDQVEMARGRPPPRISSSPAMPVETRSGSTPSMAAPCPSLFTPVSSSRRASVDVSDRTPRRAATTGMLMPLPALLVNHDRSRPFGTDSSKLLRFRPGHDVLRVLPYTRPYADLRVSLPALRPRVRGDRLRRRQPECPACHATTLDKQHSHLRHARRRCRRQPRVGRPLRHRCGDPRGPAAAR